MKKLFLMIGAAVGAILPFGKANAYTCTYTYSDGTTKTVSFCNDDCPYTHNNKNVAKCVVPFSSSSYEFRSEYEYERDSDDNIIKKQHTRYQGSYGSYSEVIEKDDDGNFREKEYKCSQSGNCFQSYYNDKQGIKFEQHSLNGFWYDENGNLISGYDGDGYDNYFECSKGVCNYTGDSEKRGVVDTSVYSSYICVENYAINDGTCEYCSDDSDILSCRFEDGRKVVECKNGAYLDGDECYECWDSDAQSCHLDDDGYMRTECRDGYMTTTCEDCDEWCMDVDDCEADYGYARGTDEAQNICFELPSDCIAVNNNGSCKTCDSAYYLNGDWCDSCPDNAASCYLDNADRMITTCENGYLEKNGECVDASDGCGSGYKDMGGFCNRVQWTPAEAAKVLRNDNTNEVTITFKK